MVLGILDSGWKVIKKERELCSIKMEVNMMENGRRANLMEKDY